MFLRTFGVDLAKKDFILDLSSLCFVNRWLCLPFRTVIWSLDHDSFTLCCIYLSCFCFSEAIVWRRLLDLEVSLLLARPSGTTAAVVVGLYYDNVRALAAPSLATLRGRINSIPHLTFGMNYYKTLKDQ